MTVRLFTCIVSHGHANLLMRSLTQFVGVEDVHVCVVDNVGESALEDFCKSHNITYVAHPGVTLGFGANNNLAFRYFEASYNAEVGDYFVCCNPDVLISAAMLAELKSTLQTLAPSLAGINLFTDEELRHHDPSIRRFPTFADYLGKLFRRNSDTALDKSRVTVPVASDWAAGSFLIFSTPLFKALKGFDEQFFMYFEDVDICLRAWRQEGHRLMYLPNIHAVHFAAFRNRTLFSKHFYWYFRSLLRYFSRFYFGGRRPQVKGASSR